MIVMMIKHPNDVSSFFFMETMRWCLIDCKCCIQHRPQLCTNLITRLIYIQCSDLRISDWLIYLCLSIGFRCNSFNLFCRFCLQPDRAQCTGAVWRWTMCCDCTCAGYNDHLNIFNNVMESFSHCVKGVSICIDLENKIVVCYEMNLGIFRGWTCS